MWLIRESDTEGRTPMSGRNDCDPCLAFNRETSIKSCGQSTESIQSLLGDKWETSIKSCGQRTQSIQSLLGDKWETNGTQV